MEGKEIKITKQNELAKDALVDVREISSFDNTLNVKAAFDTLMYRKVDIFNKDISETIEGTDWSFLICKKEADGKLYPVLKIKGANLDETERLMKALIRYQTTEMLKEYIEDNMISILSNKITIETKGQLSDMADKIPTAQNVWKLIYDTYQDHDKTYKQKYSAWEKITSGLEPWQKANLDMLDILRKEQLQALESIKRDFELNTWIDTSKYKNSSTVEPKDPIELSLATAKDKLVQWNSQLINIQSQFDAIIRLATDVDFKIKWKYTLSEDKLRKFDIPRIAKLHKFLDKLNIQVDADKTKNELEFDIAFSNLEDKDRKSLTDYLEQVSFGKIDPTKEPFVPTNLPAATELVRKYPELKKYIQLETIIEHKKDDGKWLTGHIHGTWLPDAWWVVPVQIQDRRTRQSYESFLKAWGIWGLGWLFNHLLDKSNMTEQQKETWWAVGNLAVVAWGVYVWWKMLSSAWKLLRGTDKENKEKQTKNRQWLLWPIGVTLAANAAFGESPTKIFTWGNFTKWVAEKIWWIAGWEAWKENKTIAKYEWLAGVVSLFSECKYGEVADFLTEDSNGKMKINEDSREAMIEAYKKKNNDGAVAFLNGIWKKDKHNIVHLWLSAMWIKNIAQLKANPDTPFKEMAAGAIIRLQYVSQTMEDWHYTNINPKKMDKVEKFIANKDAKIEVLKELEAQWDVFERESESADKAILATKIKEIAGTDTTRELALLEGINRFYAYMPTADKQIELIGSRPNIKFKTYGYPTPIDLSGMWIDWLQATCWSYAELFKAASLTNYIKSKCTDRVVYSKDPFKKTLIGRDVKIDDAETLGLSMDTEILSAWKRWALEEISPTLESKKDEYIAYLNKNVQYKLGGKTINTYPSDLKPAPYTPKPAADKPDEKTEAERKAEEERLKKEAEAKAKAEAEKKAAEEAEKLKNNITYGALANNGDMSPDIKVTEAKDKELGSIAEIYDFSWYKFDFVANGDWMTWWWSNGYKWKFSKVDYEAKYPKRKIVAILPWAQAKDTPVGLETWPVRISRDNNNYVTGKDKLNLDDTEKVKWKELAQTWMWIKEDWTVEYGMFKDGESHDKQKETAWKFFDFRCSLAWYGKWTVSRKILVKTKDWSTHLLKITNKDVEKMTERLWDYHWWIENFMLLDTKTFSDWYLFDKDGKEKPLWKTWYEFNSVIVVYKDKTATGATT